MNML